MFFGTFKFRMLARYVLILRERIYLDLENLERIKDAHCDGVGALICYVTAYPSADFFVGLADVYRLPIIIVEDVNSPFEPPDMVLTGFVGVLQLCVGMETFSKRLSL